MTLEFTSLLDMTSLFWSNISFSCCYCF